MYTFHHALTQPGCGEDDVMDVQFEMAGRLVPMEELEARLELPTLVQTIRQVVNKLEQQPDQALCPDHGVAAAVLVIVSASGIGLRVSGCCQPFVDTVQANLRGALTAAHTTSDGLTGLNLVVHLPDWNKAYEFEVGRIDRLVIGRVDTRYRPTARY